MRGGNGRDVLIGGEGNDVFAGGGGIDVCNGGAGRDAFTLTRGAGHLIVQDYQDGVDRASLPDGVRFNQLDLERRGTDIYVFFRGDLLAIAQNQNL